MIKYFEHLNFLLNGFEFIMGNFYNLNSQQYPGPAVKPLIYLTISPLAQPIPNNILFNGFIFFHEIIFIINYLQKQGDVIMVHNVFAK